MTHSTPVPSVPSSPSSQSGPPMVVRKPDDLIAMVPLVLGFHPEESVVMLTFGTDRPFHARVDLPPPEHVDDVLEVLCQGARLHGVAEAVLVLPSHDAERCEELAPLLVDGFVAAGIRVADVLRIDGSRWYPLRHGRPRSDQEAQGVPYDVSAHPFTVQAIVAGQVTHASREALAASIATDREAAAAVAEALGPVSTRPRWVSRTVARLVSSGERADDATAARLLLALRVPECRDAAWAGLRRDNAAAHLELWSGLLRRAPDPLAGCCAAVLALAAYMAGQGALAWCAVDRAEREIPGQPLARLVADVMGAAVSPQQWEEVMATARQR